jgi:hypothetical protein
MAKALAKSPGGRYERCLDFAEALLAACLPGATGAGVPYSPTRAAMPAAPATVADSRRPRAGRGPIPRARPPARGGSHPPAGAGYPSAGTGFPPPPPAGFPPQPPVRTGFPPPPAEPDPATLRWSGQPGPAYAGDGGGRDRRRSRGAFTAGLVAALLVLFAAAGGVTYFVLHKTGGPGPGARGRPVRPSVPASSAPTAPAGSSASPAPPSPRRRSAATVRAYYAAINNHRYARAWRLGGRQHR